MFFGTLAQDERFEALDRKNSTAGEICVVGCFLGSELVSADSLRMLMCVSHKKNVDCLTGSLPACLVTRSSTCTKLGQIGTSENGGNTTYSAFSPAASAVGFGSTNHTKPSGFATDHLESDFVPPDPMCEEKKCLDVATSDSSMLAQVCTDLTSGDQSMVMCAAGYTGGAKTSTSCPSLEFKQTVQRPRVPWTVSQAA